MDKYIKEQFNQIGIKLDETQDDSFTRYYEMLVEKNKVMNLTAITEYEEVVQKHFVDSVSLNRAVDLNEYQDLIDVGTGAGFPGIPIKIMYPDLNVTLADSLNKRVKFLDDVIRTLKLDNIEAVHGRAEDLAHNNLYREKYDICVSRAVANLSILAEYCLPFVKVGGKFISYKSDSVDEEIQIAKNAIESLGGKIVKVDKFQIGDNGRCFVVIEKCKITPKKFPRKAGIPSKMPLM